jgi:glutaconate CoA-transferase, subunit B
VRLPGGGGAPEIAGSCHEVLVTAKHSRRTFVDEVDFITSLGHGRGTGDRERAGLTTTGPVLVITDLCTMEPDPETAELTVTSLHPDVSREHVREATGWTVRFADEVATTPPPSSDELHVLRELQERTEQAHARA